MPFCTAHSSQTRLLAVKFYMEHPVHQRRGHGPVDGIVLRPVASANDDRPLRQTVFSDAAFQNERIKCFLYLVGTGVQLIQKQTVRFLPCDNPGWTKYAASLYDLRHTDDVLRGKLAAQQRNALQSHIRRKLPYNGRFSDAGSAPDKHRANSRHIQQHIHKLVLIYLYWQIQR